MEEVDRPTVEAALEAISSELEAVVTVGHLRHPPDGGLHGWLSVGGGIPGTALFFAERYRVLGDPRAKWLAQELLERAVRHVCRPMPLGFHWGLAGLDWMGRQLVELGIVPNVDVLSAPSSAFESVATIHGNRMEGFDVVSGLAGIGLALAGRSDETDFLGRLALRLLARSSEERGLRSWLIDPGALSGSLRESYSEGYCDTGLAHGVSGVVCCYAALNNVGVHPGALEVVVEGAIKWLQSTRSGRNYGMRFPYRVDRRTGASEFAGLGWCTGDLSVMNALIWAGRSFKRKDWTDEGLRLGISCALENPAVAKPIEVGLCHGTAGVMHLFSRHYQASEEPHFLKAARDWLGLTLEFFQARTPLGGFARAYTHGYTGRSIDLYHYGLLNGLSGVGLALLGALYGVGSSWDEAMCLGYL